MHKLRYEICNYKLSVSLIKRKGRFNNVSVDLTNSRDRH
jgi:hypothetical protein